MLKHRVSLEVFYDPAVKRKQVKYKSFDDVIFKITGKRKQTLLTDSIKKQKEPYAPIDILKRKEVASQIVQDFFDNDCKITK